MRSGLAALIERVAPEVVVCSGDLTHRGRAAQHEQAAAFLRGLGRPVLAVPGNHDIPYTFPARFTRTFAEFERQWETSEPVYRSEELVVVGLNSVRPWRHQSGGLRESQLERARELLADAPEGALRVAVLHHHLIGAPWRTRKRPVARRDHVLAGLVDAGAELILSGHTHQSAVSERHEFEVWAEGQSGTVVVTAPGLGQPRPRRRGEARGLHVIEPRVNLLSVDTRVWTGGEWASIAHRLFPRRRPSFRVAEFSTTWPMHYELLETSDGWQLPKVGSSHVTRCFLDGAAFGLVACNDNYESFEIRIETHFSYEFPGGRQGQADPADDAALRPLVEFRNKVVNDVRISREGQLDLDFADGSKIHVSPDPKYESWRVSGPGRILIHGTPSGPAFFGGLKSQGAVHD